MKFIIDTEQHTIAPHEQQVHGAMEWSWFDDAAFEMLSRWWLQASWQRRYSYQFRWLGRPIIQLPTDVMMMQDLIHRVRPTLIVETGIAHGGSAVFHASMLRLVHGCHSDRNRPHVIAIDVEIRANNRNSLDQHPLRTMMTLVEGSSTDPAVVQQVRSAARPDDRIMVILDSCHDREHVLNELHAYAPLALNHGAVVVMDSIMPELADLPRGNEHWRHDHPGRAIEDFLQSDCGHGFIVDRTYQPFALTHSPGGVLIAVNA